MLKRDGLLKRVLIGEALLKRGLNRGVTQKWKVGSIELYDSGSSSRGGGFFLLVDLGLGAAAVGMRNPDRDKHWVIEHKTFDRIIAD